MGKMLQGNDPGTATNLVFAKLFRKNTTPLTLEISYLGTIVFKLYSSPALTSYLA